MTIAITGPDGVLGRHVRASLEQARLAVLPVGRSVWDLRQYNSIEQLDGILSGVDAVVHCGALTPTPGTTLDRAELMDANVRACVALGSWAARRRVPLIYAGSAGVYDRQAMPANEEAPLAPMPDGGFYGLTKLLGEMALTGLQSEGLPLCVLRITSIYGAGLHPGKLVARMLATALSGKTITMRPPVDDLVNLVHAADVASAVLAALQRNARGIFNVGGSSMGRMIDLAKACVAVAGGGDITIEEAAGEGTAPPARRFDVSIRKAGDELGYKPKVGFSEGLTMMKESRYVR